jgi:F0F1-type ATP synthase assembly protein I
MKSDLILGILVGVYLGGLLNKELKLFNKGE